MFKNEFPIEESKKYTKSPKKITLKMDNNSISYEGEFSLKLQQNDSAAEVEVKK